MDCFKRVSTGLPETPRFKVIHPDQDLELIDPEFQSRYRSGNGIILSLTNY
jgi:hypothetical protein